MMTLVIRLLCRIEQIFDEKITASVPFSGADAALFFILSDTALRLQAFD